MFQVFLSFNTYSKNISNFTFIKYLKLMMLFVLSNHETYYIFFDGFRVESIKNIIIYVD